MDQPRQGFKVNRFIQKYLIRHAKLPVFILFRDLVLTILMWGVYITAFYRAFLYVEQLYTINHIPNLTKQQKVVLTQFYEDLRIYLVILAMLLLYLMIRLFFNMRKWRRMRNNEKVSLPSVGVEAQAAFFKAAADEVVLARKSRICMIDTSSEDGSVLSIEVIEA